MASRPPRANPVGSSSQIRKLAQNEGGRESRPLYRLQQHPHRRCCEEMSKGPFHFVHMNPRAKTTTPSDERKKYGHPKLPLTPPPYTWPPINQGITPIFPTPSALVPPIFNNLPISTEFNLFFPLALNMPCKLNTTPATIGDAPVTPPNCTCARILTPAKPRHAPRRRDILTPTHAHPPYPHHCSTPSSPSVLTPADPAPTKIALDSLYHSPPPHPLPRPPLSWHHPHPNASPSSPPSFFAPHEPPIPHS